jgi:TolB-like protein
MIFTLDCSFDTPLQDPVYPLRAPRGLPLVAVMPFSAHGADPALVPMGLAIANTLREGLMQSPRMEALLVQSEVLEKAPPHAVELICRELRVGHLIGGKCHGTGTEPSLYVEVADTRGWHVQWAHFYRGGARALLEPGSQSMATLVDILRRALAPDRPPTTPRA